ncbi:MAG TPA: cytochrome c oxidase subunit II [Solirubrobacteraceae bacterium]|jgi:cytochrome c oxidase subunit 2|nr:cytochrome c oxidase subunit II [Solirubrobacteraceae bacterium]
MLAVGLALGLGLLQAPSALAGTLIPESGGSQAANNVSSLYTITLYIAIVIFIGVEGAIVYCLYRFRARRGREAKQLHGNTRLEIGWTLGAALIVVALATITFLDLHSIRDPSNSGPGGLDLNTGVQYETTGTLKPPDGRALTIQVNGIQYLWRYTYLGVSSNADGLGDPYTTYQMVVPTNTTVVLKVVSQDVVHEWWIPQLGGKVQAVPGYVNETWFKIPKPGNYKGQCSFLCGRGHARMIAEVTAVSPQKYKRWLAQLQKNLTAADINDEKCRQQLAQGTGPASVEITKNC